ncbi:anthranilate synthase family protein [Actinomadura sp. 6N118]|uniref:anthranilate synthase family protein n=1 Tax=Actinomadura sp. 6N118 TaxID=3375151 RepID=UPI0037B8C2C6
MAKELRSFVDRLGSGAAGPFALICRADDPGRADVLTGDICTVGKLADLPSASPSRGVSRHEMLALIPYRQIDERGFACRDDGEPIRVLTVAEQGCVDTASLLESLPQTPVRLRDGRFDIDDDGYAEIVGDVQAREIGGGQGSNFVIHRSFVAALDDYTPAQALAVFGRLLAEETGAYWTFVAHTGDRTFVGASPEQHVGLQGGTVTMNPISGTHRYGPLGPSVSQTLDFLTDRKEADELYMVVDEELKMMARICDPGVRLHGPRLREMARLAHTEYLLSGHSTASVQDILRTTMFAPTVTGSPLENACRTISRYEPFGRGYYSGIAALIGIDEAGDPTVDSTILIRCADIHDDGRVRIGVGATLVRHSDPQSEVAETKAKAATILNAFRGEDDPSGSAPSPQTRCVGADPAVQEALRRRNATLARFWLGDDVPASASPVSRLAGKRVLIVDAEDTFTSMIGHQLRALHLDVTIRRYDEPCTPESFDLVVVGPGPGDPCDDRSRKTRLIRHLISELLRQRRPFLAVCFGHQVLCRELGLTVSCLEVPNQGLQREIDLFGRRTRVGFYNTFMAGADGDHFISPAAGGTVEVSRDGDTGHVHALRGPGFRSLQFHAESVLSTDGITILGELLAGLVAAQPGNLAAAQPGDPLPAQPELPSDTNTREYGHAH